MGVLDPLLNRKSGRSIRNEILLCKQFIRSMIDYAYPAWRSATRSHVRRPQVSKFKCLRLVKCAPWYLSNRHIHEDLGVSLFAYHIRDLTASVGSNLTDVGNHLVRQLGDIYADRWLSPPPVAEPKCGWGQQAGRGHR
jgi:hypothetical protein